MLHGRRREGPMGEVSLDTLHSSLWHRLLVLPLGWALPCHPLYSLALKPFTPAVPFTCPFFFSPQKSRAGGGDESCQRGPGRGGDRLSGILYSCSNNTNWEKTRPLKLLVV